MNVIALEAQDRYTVQLEVTGEIEYPFIENMRLFKTHGTTTITQSEYLSFTTDDIIQQHNAIESYGNDVTDFLEPIKKIRAVAEAMGVNYRSKYPVDEAVLQAQVASPRPVTSIIEFCFAATIPDSAIGDCLLPPGARDHLEANGWSTAIDVVSDERRDGVHWVKFAMASHLSPEELGDNGFRYHLEVLKTYINVRHEEALGDGCAPPELYMSRQLLAVLGM